MRDNYKVQYKMNADPTKLWAERLRVERARRNWSRADLAIRLQSTALTLGIGGIRGVTSLRTYSRRWEAGEVLPDWKHQLLLAAVYGLGLVELFGNDTDPAIPPALMTAMGGTVELPYFAQAEDVAVDRRAFVSWLGALAAGTTALPEQVRRAIALPDDQADLLPAITMGDVANLDSANTAFTQWEETVGGSISRQAVTAHLAWAVAQLEAGVPGHTTVLDSWRVSTARLAQTAGWMAHDAGREYQGRSLLTLGYRIASTVEDESAGGPAQVLLLSKLARQAIDVGRPRTGLAIAQHAQGIADSVSPTARYTLHAIKARALGALGDESTMRRELGLAEDSFSHISEEDLVREPWSRVWQTIGQMHYNVGSAYQLLLRTDCCSAPEKLTELTAEQFVAGAQRWGVHRTRDWASAQLRAATVLMAGKRPEQAVKTACEALTVLPRLRSGRVDDEVRGLRCAAAPFRRRSDVASLVHELSATPA